MKGCPFWKLFIIYVRWKKYQSRKHWPRLGLLKIKPKFGHSKVHSYLLVKVFVAIFLNPYLFPIMYHILSLYKMYCDEIITKNAFEC
jgi:hypothetical protein